MNYSWKYILMFMYFLIKKQKNNIIWYLSLQIIFNREIANAPTVKFNMNSIVRAFDIQNYVINNFSKIYNYFESKH